MGFHRRHRGQLIACIVSPDTWLHYTYIKTHHRDYRHPTQVTHPVLNTPCLVIPIMATYPTHPENLLLFLKNTALRFSVSETTLPTVMVALGTTLTPSFP